MLHELGGCNSPGFSWSIVSKTLGGGRLGKSCRSRWCGIASRSGCYIVNDRRIALTESGCAGPRCNQLSPDVKKVAFSEEEDAILVKVTTQAAVSLQSC